MSVSAISSSSVAATYTPPPQAQQAPVKPQAQAAAKDTVSISPQARQLASDGDPTALEAQETAAARASEASKGKA